MYNDVSVDLSKAVEGLGFVLLDGGLFGGIGKVGNFIS